MPSRKPHEKNRHGCHQCKARRVKCDLRLPKCSNCERRCETCIRGEVQIVTGASLSPTSLAAAPPPPASQGLPLPILELELMHHFSTVVYLTLSDESAVQDVWQHHVPMEAVRHHHLMHAILALSALHLQIISKNAEQAEKYRVPAVQHYDVALSELQRLVVKVEETNCGSVLATATLLGFFSSACVRFDDEEMKILLHMWYIHQLLRGVFTIIDHTTPDFGEAKLAAIFKPTPWEDVSLPAGFQRGTDALHANIVAHGDTDGRNRDLYFSAVQRLQENVKAEIANPQHISISYMLLSAADRSFMALVAAHDQIALAIFAHYAVIFHRQRDRWWMGDKGVRMFSALRGLLESEFTALVEWPQQFISDYGGIEEQYEALHYYS
jgi:hypothetical protein